MQKHSGWLLLGCLLLAFALGAALFGAKAPPEVLEARTRTGVAWSWFALAARIALVAVAVGFLGGAGAVALKWADRRARSYYADDAGLFPAVRVGAGEALADLNRAPSGVVLGPAAGPLALPEPTEAGLRTTTQAQAVQLLAAATRDGGLTPTAAKVVKGNGPAHIAPPMPSVVVLDEPGHIERLLLEEGGDEQ